MATKKTAIRFKPENREQIVSALRFSDPTLLSSLGSLLSSAEDSVNTLTPLSISTDSLEEHRERLKALYFEGCQEFEKITGEPFNIKFSFLNTLRNRYKGNEHPHCREFVAVLDYTDRHYNRNLRVGSVENHSYFYALVRHLTRLHNRIATLGKHPEYFHNYSPLTFIRDYRGVPAVRNSFVREGDEFYSEAVRLLEDFPATSDSSIQVRFNPSGFVLWLISHFKTIPLISEVGKYLQTNNFTSEKRLGVHSGREVFSALISGNLSEGAVAEAEKCFERSLADFSLQMFLDTLVNSNQTSDDPADCSKFTSLIRDCKLHNSSLSYLWLLETAISTVVLSLRVIYDTHNLSGTNLGEQLRTATDGFNHITLTDGDLKTALEGVDLDAPSSSFDQIDMHLCFKSVISLCGGVSKLDVFGNPLKFTHLDTYFTPHFHLSPSVLTDFTEEEICEAVYDAYSEFLNDPNTTEEQRLFFSFYLPEIVFPGEVSVAIKHRREVDLKRMRIRYKTISGAALDLND